MDSNFDVEDCFALKIQENLTPLLTNMDILFSRLVEFSLIEFKCNSHYFYGMNYWRNW